MKKRSKHTTKHNPQEHAFKAGIKWERETGNPRLTADEATYLNISMIGYNVALSLEQYMTDWMPKKLRLPYEKLISDAYKMADIAEKLSGVKIDD